MKNYCAKNENKQNKTKKQNNTVLFIKVLINAHSFVN